MADFFNRNPMMPGESQQAATARGGLASEDRGGLSKFMGDVAKGAQAVLSHPLYQRLWSGAVSGMAGDAMAGPMAVAQLQQAHLSQDMQAKELDSMGKPTIQDELAQLRLNRMRDSDRARQRLYQDPRNATEADRAQAFPDQYGQSLFDQSAAPRPVPVMGPNGPEYVSPADAIGMRPVPRRALVEINNGMRPDQQFAAEDRSKKTTDSETAKLRDALDAHASLTALVSKIRAEGRAPNSNETDSIVKMAARLENPEMVGEGDMARKAGGGASNYFRSLLNQPFQLDGRQFDSIVGTADVIADQKRRRLEEITNAAQGVAAGRGLNPAAVTPTLPSAPVSSSEQPPSGAKPHSSIPNVFVLPNGDWWAP